MRALIIKTSSMGDVIHTLPALTDAVKAYPALSFDWVVEENFSDIPRWHSVVQNVIPVAIRRWKKNPRAKQTWLDLRCLWQALRKNQYDFIIDAQGLLKSAVLARLARGVRCGFDRASARESMAACFYQRGFKVEKNQHAISRIRQLFSLALGYDLPAEVDYGVESSSFHSPLTTTRPYLVFLHGTTWPTKHWPESYWIDLMNKASEQGWEVKLPWGNAVEKARAERIALNNPLAVVLPRLSLTEMAGVLAKARGVVGVDTGLGHLAAMLNVPTVSIYGPTDPALTGTVGKNQIQLSAHFPCAPCLGRLCTYRDPGHPPLNPSPLNPPCFTTLPPSVIWNSLLSLL